MEFKQEELVEREIEIANYLLQKISLSQIALKTGISKKHVIAHIRNMMTKAKVNNIESLTISLNFYKKTATKLFTYKK